MLSLRMLRTLRAVARSGSFALAAQNTALTQAAVSLQMRGLEEALERQLFDRRARQVAFTREGEEICAKVERILELIDELPASADDTLQGSVIIGAVVSVIGALSLAVAHLKTGHPELEVRLTSARSAELAEMVQTGEVDVAVVVGNADGALHESLAWTPLYEEPLMLVTSRATKGNDARRILRERNFLRFDRRVPTGAVIDEALRMLGIKPQEYLELNSIETIVSLVRNDVGVSVLPVLHNGNWRDDPNLKLVELNRPPFLRTVGMIHRKSNRRTVLFNTLAQMLRE
ncbi:LysR family transcriptional regulator [Paraburkholderia eburnea]|uniref:LysR family transcriptional regulator n=1 Tax=Paraburkholderia eburnea TaxID=1189126 RepID=A0A2S4MBP1_9BURK|nr:LysR substrate-binding domain-containing protein [Paraburkholderia eburnea]POR52124.1 LysR family transcriptional regulator [Paraburkholderia eburnea]PRZ23015.1 LysR family transcriptional regulator [Paraburkholderia eburnea]